MKWNIPHPSILFSANLLYKANLHKITLSFYRSTLHVITYMELYYIRVPHYTDNVSMILDKGHIYMNVYEW